MMQMELDEANGMVLIAPTEQLREEDFITLSVLIDGYLLEHEKLNGLIIYTKEFPGWDSLSALFKHLSFVKNHHKQIRRLALVTDSELVTIFEKISQYFVNVEIEVYAYDMLESAKAWIIYES